MDLLSESKCVFAVNNKRQSVNCGKRRTTARATYDSDDLLQRQAESNDDGLRLLGDGSRQRRIVAVPEDVVDQPLLVWSAARRCTRPHRRHSFTLH